METKQTAFPTPPWDMETAAKRLTFEEAAWNSHDPERVLEGYADNIEMRDGVVFMTMPVMRKDGLPAITI